MKRTIRNESLKVDDRERIRFVAHTRGGPCLPCQPLRAAFRSLLGLGSGLERFPDKREWVENAEALTGLPTGSLIRKDISGTRCRILTHVEDRDYPLEIVELQGRQPTE